MRHFFLLMLCGCSWAFMTKPPAVVATPNYPVDCTSSRAAPVLDTICAGYFVLNGAVLLATKDCASASFGERCYDSSTKTGGALLSGGLALLCAVSAGSGYSAASRCEAVKDENALCITGNEAACRQLNPSWVPSPAGVAPSGAAPGCMKDTDCKGNRICVSGACVEPR